MFISFMKVFVSKIKKWLLSTVDLVLKYSLVYSSIFLAALYSTNDKPFFNVFNDCLSGQSIVNVLGVLWLFFVDNECI